MKEKLGEWHYWRGSPELLAQLARSAVRHVRDHAGTEPTCRITVRVDDDHEVFSTPGDLIEDISPEALQRFKYISIVAEGGGFDARICLHWNRSWYQVGNGPDADVRLKVTGPGQTAVDEVFTGVRAALVRSGTAGGEGRLNVAAFASMFFWLLVVAAIAGGLYLLGASDSAVAIVAGAGSAVAGLGGVFFAAWVYPPLEVAPGGDTRVRRLLKVLGPAVLAVVVASVKKLVS